MRLKMVQQKSIWSSISGHLKKKNDELVERDIRAVVEAAKGKALTKVLLKHVF